MSEPWYRDGLRFRCTRCGNCCTGAPGYVWVTDKELSAIAAYRAEEVEVLVATQTRLIDSDRSLREKANGDCTFFDRQAGCTIYQVRPQQCRTWPFWAATVSSPAAWEKTCVACPGAGHGDLVSAEDITRRVSLTCI